MTPHHFPSRNAAMLAHGVYVRHGGGKPFHKWLADNQFTYGCTDPLCTNNPHTHGSQVAAA